MRKSHRQRLRSRASCSNFLIGWRSELTDTHSYRVYLTHTPTCIALHDKFPKSKFHFIILPRLPFRIPQSARSTEDDTAMIFVAADRLHDLRALAKSEKALEVLLQLKACSEEVRRHSFCWRFWLDNRAQVVSLIQEEMVAQEGALRVRSMLLLHRTFAYRSDLADQRRLPRQREHATSPSTRHQSRL